MRLQARVRSALARFPGLQALVRRWRNPDRAALDRAMADRRLPLILQPHTTTADDRYPDLFDNLAGALDSRPDAKVLSFGCSGGEEVRALRCRLPEASITGVDINPRAIARARRKDRHSRSQYLVADRPPAGEVYDAVLALAVFRHGTLGVQKPDDCAAVLPFARVADAFALLDQALLPGGLLAWGNAHFRLSELPGGDRYVLVFESTHLEIPEVVYGEENRRKLPIQSDRGGLYLKT